MKYVRALFTTGFKTGSMTPAALLLAAIALAHGSALAGVQWKWKDANGAIQYSDRPPPPGTPDSHILARPVGSKAPAQRAQAPQPVSQVTEAASAASTPKSEDPELEARRKKAAAEEAAKKKAEEEKIARQKADNCQRARSYQRSLQDGIRIVRTSPNGEREILDDKGRADEMQRTQESIQNNCN